MSDIIAIDKICQDVKSGRTSTKTSDHLCNRRIRVFISSTFRDMVGERDELMTHAWPELRGFCRERQVELVEVDLRWGIAEEQSTRKETLKLCLDEIRACRPFFIGLLGERYGWVPGDDAFTADLREEQPWLRDLHGKSVTEMEILHGVLNNPDMAGRAFFYFRDPQFVETVPADRKSDFTAEDAASAEKQTCLKHLIRQTCAAKNIPLRENYPDPRQLAAFVLADIKAAIEAQFPIAEIPDPLTREARDHEAFAEIRRRTYIGRDDYFQALDRHAAGNDGPLVLLGESGGGKSALVANWLERWRDAHPQDFLFQHYIGGTPDSAEHERLMTRLVGEIKRWTGDPEDLPKTRDDLLRDFPLWLAKARAWAAHLGVRCIVVLDALNQLEDRDHARSLGWLPEHPFTGPLRLIVSTLPGEALDAVRKRGWKPLPVEPLSTGERERMIAHYLACFGKKLDPHRQARLAAAPAAANPLYLKILLDELRVTGTHDQLDEKLTGYLAAPDIPALLAQVLARWRHDYERDRPGLVGEVLGLVWAARRGLTENELLRLLKPADQPQLPLAVWTPLRAALEDGLVDRAGILNFAHDFLRAAVATMFAPDETKQRDLRLHLADFFEAEPVTARACDELPWLLWQAESSARLRACLLDIDRFLQIRERDQDELMRYWVWLKEERNMGKPYVQAFELWAEAKGETATVSYTASCLAHFLAFRAALHSEAEPLMSRAIGIAEKCYGQTHPQVAIYLGNLASLLHDTNCLDEAEPLKRRALAIDEASFGPNHPAVARDLNNLARLLQETNRLAEAEPLMRRALDILESSLGADNPNVAIALNNLAHLLQCSNRLVEAEPLMRRALAVDEACFGQHHPNVAVRLSNLASLLQETNRLAEAEPLMRRALSIDEASFGQYHPNVAIRCSNLATLLQDTNRLGEAEPLKRRALAIDEASFGQNHPNVAIRLNNLAHLLQATNRLAEAEPLMRRALAVDETSFGQNHPNVARHLNNLATLLQDTNRYGEAEPLLRQALAIDEASLGKNHPNVARDLGCLAILLQSTNRFAESEPLIRRALAIDEASFGPNHPNVAIRLNNLAHLLQATNRLDEAEPLMRRALAIVEASFGQHHPNIANCLNNLAHLLQVTNRLDEAEPLIRRALAIDEVSYGKNHTNVAICLNNLAQLLQATNRMGEAEPLMRRALAIWEVSLGKEHPKVAIALNNLAHLLQATNRLAEAEPLLRRALAIDEASFGKNHPDVARDLNNLARLLQETNRMGEAEPLMRRALVIWEISLGTEHPNVAIALNNLANLLQATDRLGEAEPLMRRALAIDEQSFGPSHPRVLTRLNNLAFLLQATNRMDEAEPLMRRAVEIHLELARCNQPHSDYMPTLGNYASLLMSMGRSADEARKMLDELHGRYGLSMLAPKPASPSSKRPVVMEKDKRDAFVGSQLPEELHPGSARRVSPVKDLAISLVLILSAVWGPTISPWFWILSVPLLLLGIFHLVLSIPQVRKWFQAIHDEAKRRQQKP